MKRRMTAAVAIVLLLISASLPAGTDLLEKLKKDMSDGELEKFSPIEAAFVLSGAYSKEKLFEISIGL